MADGFDIVAVRIEHERPVVMRVIVRPQSGLAVVAASGRQRGSVERVDIGPGLRRERDVETAADDTLTVADPEIRLAVLAEARLRRAAGLLGRQLHDDSDAERLERGLVEPLAVRKVGHGETDMVEHANLLQLQFGLRLSRNAPSPSWPSAETRRRAISAALSTSARSALCFVMPPMRSASCLASDWAIGPPLASASSASSTAASSSPGVTSRCTSPMR